MKHRLGCELKRLRGERQLSLREVTKIIGVSNSYLCQLETGKIINPSLSVSIKLCRIYGVTIEDFARWSEPDEPNANTLNELYERAIQALDDEQRSRASMTRPANVNNERTAVVLAALAGLGYYVSRAELRQQGSRCNQISTNEIQVTLDELVAAGRVEVVTRKVVRYPGDRTLVARPFYRVIRGTS